MKNPASKSSEDSLIKSNIHTYCRQTRTHSQTSEREFQLSKYRLTGVAPESTGKLPTQCLNQEVLPLHNSERHTADCTALTILDIRLCQHRKTICSLIEECQGIALTFIIIGSADISSGAKRNVHSKDSSFLQKHDIKPFRTI